MSHVLWWGGTLRAWNGSQGCPCKPRDKDLHLPFGDVQRWREHRICSLLSLSAQNAMPDIGEMSQYCENATEEDARDMSI